jgi:hypothetical protein
MFNNLAIYKLVDFNFVVYNMSHFALYTFSSGTNQQKKELIVMAVRSVSGDTLPGNQTIIPSAQK